MIEKNDEEYIDSSNINEQNNINEIKNNDQILIHSDEKDIETVVNMLVMIMLKLIQILI